MIFYVFIHRMQLYDTEAFCEEKTEFKSLKSLKIFSSAIEVYEKELYLCSTKKVMQITGLEHEGE